MDRADMDLISIPPEGKRLEASVQEHEQIMDALERRSGDQLVHFLHLNLANKRKALSGQH
jgi:DNA-binding GntR family transcriptional regulator